MTDPTPTPQAPPQGLTNAQLLELAEKELCIDDMKDAHEEHYPVEVVTDGLIDYARAAIAAHEAARAQLPPNYVDPEHTGENRKLLEAFYVASRADGGTADEIVLRGLRAAIAADRAMAVLEEKDGQDQIGDGYHTLAELYEHRHSLMLALMCAKPDICWFSERHADGALPFNSSEWFIVGAELPSGSITYHLPIELLPLAQKTGAASLSRGLSWDGHNSADVVDRLRAWAENGPGLPMITGHAPSAKKVPKSTEELEASFKSWFKANNGIPPSKQAAGYAAAFALAVLRGEVAA